MSKRARRFSGVMAVLASQPGRSAPGRPLRAPPGRCAASYRDRRRSHRGRYGHRDEPVADCVHRYRFGRPLHVRIAGARRLRRVRGESRLRQSIVRGAVVFADVTQVLTVTMRKQLKTIATTTSRSSSSLVRPGTTSDVYSINAAQQARTSVLVAAARSTARIRRFPRTGRLRSDQQAATTWHSHPRRRFERGRLRVGRHSHEPRHRRLHVELRLVARAAGNCKSTPARRRPTARDKGCGFINQVIRAARIRLRGRGRDVRQPDLLS